MIVPMNEEAFPRKLKRFVVPFNPPARRVSRWRAPALSDGFGRTTGTTGTVLRAERRATEETEPFPANLNRSEPQKNGRPEGRPV